MNPFQALALSLALALQATLVAGPVRLHYWPEQRPLAARVLEQLQPATLTFPGLPAGVLGEDGVDVWLAPDQARWDSLTGGAIPEWGAGVADPVRGVIVIPAFDWERTPLHTLRTTLVHELAHVALQRYLGPARTPRWFTEGYAQWAAGQWTFDATWQLSLALLGDRAPPLDSLTLDWPVAEADARLAYLLSASAVTYLVDRSGEHGLRVLLDRWREQADFDTAFRSTYGLTMGQFEEDWRAHVKSRYGWSVFLGQSAFFWLIAAIILVVLVLVRRRRDRARLGRLRATEPPDEPAYWEESVDDGRTG
ncbi:MAG TPA: peptidase MA family metallohydrolase [Longimicrobiales bacterium]|nr:peptidase MA family metallohydrolase [Longimicrobiales bacterium]